MAMRLKDRRECVGSLLTPNEIKVPCITTIATCALTLANVISLISLCPGTHIRVTCKLSEFSLRNLGVHEVVRTLKSKSKDLPVKSCYLTYDFNIEDRA